MIYLLCIVAALLGLFAIAAVVVNGDENNY